MFFVMGVFGITLQRFAEGDNGVDFYDFMKGIILPRYVAYIYRGLRKGTPEKKEKEKRTKKA